MRRHNQIHTLGAPHYKAHFWFLRKLKDSKCVLWSGQCGTLLLTNINIIQNLCFCYKLNWVSSLVHFDSKNDESAFYGFCAYYELSCYRFSSKQANLGKRDFKIFDKFGSGEENLYILLVSVKIANARCVNHMLSSTDIVISKRYHNCVIQLWTKGAITVW